MGGRLGGYPLGVSHRNHAGGSASRRHEHGARADPVDLPPMDPRDDLDSLAGGVGCAACGEIVPSDRIRILARRDDLVFVEVACPGCRSESLGIVVTEGVDESDEADGPDPTGLFEIASGEFGGDDVDRFRDAAPIGVADVDTVRRLLARGGLSALVGGEPPPSSGSAR